MRIALFLSFIFVLVMLGGCASKEKKFERILPGMTSREAKDAMDEGPTRFERVEGTSFTRMYWDNEYCVLLQNDKVVTKDSSQVGRQVKLGPGEYVEKKTAECLAPGQVSESGVDRTVDIPGVGKVQLPKENKRKPSTDSSPHVE